MKDFRSCPTCGGPMTSVGCENTCFHRVPGAQLRTNKETSIAQYGKHPVSTDVNARRLTLSVSFERMLTA